MPTLIYFIAGWVIATVHAYLLWGPYGIGLMFGLGLMAVCVAAEAEETGKPAPQGAVPSEEITPEMLEAAHEYLGVHWPFEWPDTIPGQERLFKGLFRAMMARHPLFREHYVADPLPDGIEIVDSPLYR